MTCLWKTIFFWQDVSHILRAIVKISNDLETPIFSSHWASATNLLCDFRGRGYFNSYIHKMEILNSFFFSAFPEILRGKTQIASVANFWKSKLWKFENWSQQNTWESVSVWGPLTGIKTKELDDEGKVPFAKASYKLSSSKANNLCAEGYWWRVQCLIFSSKTISKVVLFYTPKFFLPHYYFFLQSLGFSVKTYLNSRK